MSYDIRTIRSFDKEFKRLAKKYPSLRLDVEELIVQLQSAPYMGADMGKGVHKVRLNIRSKRSGKRGGARVITFTDVVIEVAEGTIYFLSIYDKSEQSTISDEAITDLLREAGVL